ncbi:VOC family protein [Aridibaculum aurantiacum]|uniref:VOC family protein n=1 Tax=Aridibaculum aurantiacum TaxID=2810307 RepID=UPI001A97740E|nr:VOC family protein [Aridibaculum aurantiacum]
MKSLVTGIQQVGIGVVNAQEAKHYYKDLFGMDVLVFEDKAEASLMTRYTGNEVHSREAILTLNMQGGGGFELWQFQSRQPAFPFTQPTYGDIGIYGVKMRSCDIDSLAENFPSYAPVTVSPHGQRSSWMKDINGNNFQVVEYHQKFKTTRHCVGGVLGVVIGVSDMERSVAFYKDLLDLQEVVFDVTGTFDDIPTISNEQYRRVLLHKTFTPCGAFSKLLGDVEIELVQCLDREPSKIYANRYWGDCGFIHVCFDVTDMDALKQKATASAQPFTVDSADSFSMGTSAGRFAYIEDPDGTLIELVETHKVPILKKLNWYFDLKKRKKNTPLPDWMIGMMSLSKVK